MFKPLLNKIIQSRQSIAAFAVLTLIFLAGCSGEHIQSNKKERNAIQTGNKSYKEHKFLEAADNYASAIEANPESEVAKFNKALAVLVSNETDSTKRAEASNALNELAFNANSPEVAENSLYTMSNSHSVKGGATLFFTTLSLVRFPTTEPSVPLICPIRRISHRTDA